MSTPVPRARPRRVPVLTVLPADPERMEIGGIASFVRGFVKFSPDDFELSFLGISAEREPWAWHRVPFEGREVAFLPVMRVPSLRRSAVPLALRFAAALLARRDARRVLRPEEFVLGFHRPASDLGLGPRSGPRWRVVHLSVADLATPGSESRWRRGSRLLDAFEHRSFRGMDRIWVVNRNVAGRYREQFPDVADRIAFISNWVDHTIFRQLDDPDRGGLRAELRRSTALPGDARIVLFAGRLEGQKDPMLLARAFGRLREAVPGARLVVAGEGALASSMREELGRLGAADAARFVGVVPRERLAQLMNASDLLAITSAFETGPTVGLEALACGLPVVTTPVGEVAALVARSGAGVTTGARSVDAVADAMAAVLGRHEDHARAAAKAAQPFHADRVLRELYGENRRLAARLADAAPTSPSGDGTASG